MRGALVALGCLALAAPARADAENALGLGPRAGAMAGAVGASPIGLPAVHYGPAALTLGRDERGYVELGLALLWAHPLLWVEGVDGEAAPELASEPDSTAAVLLGTRFDLGHAFGLRGLSGALALYSPVTHVFSYGTHPDESPQWLMWADRTQHVSVWAGVGFRVADWLAIGASVRFLFDIALYTTGRVLTVEEMPDPNTGETAVTAETELGEELRVYGRARPIAGALVRPVPQVRFGLTWRAATRVDDWGWARVGGDTSGLGALGYVYRFQHYYRPHEVALSAAWDAGSELSVSAELTWAMWSRARSGTFEELPGRFGDTLVPAVGARWTVHRGIDLLGGYRFVRSPFDNFGGPTNLLDNDRHEPSVGMELWLEPLVGEELPFAVSWSFRLAVLHAREERKDWQRFASDEDLERNPGYPGYRHGGVVPSAQLGVEARW